MRMAFWAIAALLAAGALGLVLMGTQGAQAADRLNSMQQAPPAKTETQAPSAGLLREFTIEARNFAFSPSAISVKKGDRVRLTLKNIDGTHGLSLPAFGVSLTPAAGQSAQAEFTADKAGEHGFFCNIYCGSGHKEMAGSLTVEG